MKKKILLTGAGSLGEAFIKYLNEDLIVIDNHEETVARLSSKYPKVKFILDDFVEWKFDQNPVEYVIHTAASKHQPLGELNPNSFIDNNIIKTRKFFAEAYKNNVDLLFISSDKAVEPCCLYGYTKAIGESLARHYNFSIARCGNFLNSSGSVIPVWEQAIKDGKQIPITSEKMSRYVIEVDQAAKEIWDEFSTVDEDGNLCGNKLIIPDCEEVTIMDLLSKVLEKHNKTFKNVKIKYIGIRPLEKLREKLRWDWEEK